MVARKQSSEKLQSTPETVSNRQLTYERWALENKGLVDLHLLAFEH
jgi:hypothetical protein